MTNRSILMFALAIIFVAVALLRVPDGLRLVDIVTLIGSGVFAGVLLMNGIRALN